MKIMFVCTANTCRSVMAEHLFRTMIQENIGICSAGIAATDGKSPSKNTIEVCKNHGLTYQIIRLQLLKVPISKKWI